MTRLILIRHGQTDWNLESRWSGHADVPLNAHGREQARLLAESLRDVRLDAIFSSDLSRARETAEILGERQGLDVRVDQRLREINQGAWQGMRVSDIKSQYAERFVQHYQNPLEVSPPGGETVAQVQTRVLAALDEIGQKYPRGTVAVVFHGLAIASTLAHYWRRPITDIWSLDPQNTAKIELDIS